MKTPVLFDTTLRDGAQTQGVSFTLEDKLLIARKLDQFGVAYVEGGFPRSNDPKEREFFRKLKQVPLKHARLAAFGGTRKSGVSAFKDETLRCLVEARTPVVTLVGKSSPLHVRTVLRTTDRENLSMIASSVAYLKNKGKEVVFDSEHFFDGFKLDPEFAIRTLKAAELAGADWIVLCDTNGGCLPSEVFNIVSEVTARIKISRIGIHTHNDSDCAVANAIEAVMAGAEQVQGTINGLGERCGNTNLCSIIPDLVFKMKLPVLPKNRLKELTRLSWYVSERANIGHRDDMPFVGQRAFAHKAGMHVHAVGKDPGTYEQLDPSLVGNERKILISGDQSGVSSVLLKSGKHRALLTQNKDLARDILQRLRSLENEGYHFEAAEASFDLHVGKMLNKHKKFFDLQGYQVVAEKLGGGQSRCTATIKLKVNGVEEHAAAEGDGPVNALDGALRKALEPFYPRLKNNHLTDYKVRVLDAKEGTAAKVRVLIESTDGKETWGTVGVSENIIEASWEALVDSVEYQLLKGKSR